MGKNRNRYIENGILISMESSLNWEFSRRVRKQHSSTQEKTPENHHRDRKHLVSATIIEKQGLPQPEPIALFIANQSLATSIFATHIILFQKLINLIAVSGNKMSGCPMPCGVTLARKEHVKNVEQRIDYLNSVDTTIMGSRNGQAALYLWYSLRKKGLDGIKRDVV